MQGTGNVFVNSSSICLALVCSDPEAKVILLSDWTAKTSTLNKKGHFNIQTHMSSHMQISFLPKSHYVSFNLPQVQCTALGRFLVMAVLNRKFHTPFYPLPTSGSDFGPWDTCLNQNQTMLAVSAP